MRTVTLPFEEYNDLLKDQQDKQKLMEQLAAEAKDKGFLVQQITSVCKKDADGDWIEDYKYLTEKSTLKIFSQEEVLKAAQEEIDRLSAISYKFARMVDYLTDEIDRLKHRGLFARLFNLKR